jgi:hypothetical protein
VSAIQARKDDEQEDIGYLTDTTTAGSTGASSGLSEFEKVHRFSNEDVPYSNNNNNYNNSYHTDDDGQQQQQQQQQQPRSQDDQLYDADATDSDQDAFLVESFANTPSPGKGFERRIINDFMGDSKHSIDDDFLTETDRVLDKVDAELKLFQTQQEARYYAQKQQQQQQQQQHQHQEQQEQQQEEESVFSPNTRRKLEDREVDLYRANSLRAEQEILQQEQLDFQRARQIARRQEAAVLANTGSSDHQERQDELDSEFHLKQQEHHAVFAQIAREADQLLRETEQKRLTRQTFLQNLHAEEC